MKNNITFGENLKKLRKQAGLTRAKLSEMISYSEKSVEKWEFGKALPPMNTVCELAEIFGVTLDNLIYTPQTEVKYLLAIDGGGTKTEFLLTDLEKRELKRFFLGASNAVDIGMENCKTLLEQGIREVTQGISLREVSVYAGLAGGMTGDNKRVINEFLGGFNFAFYNNGSDVENVLEIALSGGDGVAVIMGGGIIAFSQLDGKRNRVGGWGYHIDKGGSGYNIGSDGLCYALRYVDGRSGSKMLKELIEEKLGKSLTDSIGDIYKGGKAYIASFAPLVFEAYKQGDAVAEAIIDRNVKEASEIIAAGLVPFENKETKVVICGGIGRNSEILLPFFRKYLGNDVNLHFNSEPVVNGALNLAEKNLKG